MCIGPERVAGNGATLGVELQQLLGHVAHRLLDTRLGLFPRGPAKPVQRGPGAAGVFLDQVETLDGDEQLVLAVVTQLEELLRVGGAADPELLQADEFADPVIHVDHEIADLEVAQVREKGLRQVAALFGSAPLFLEDVGLRIDLQRRIRQAETA